MPPTALARSWLHNLPDPKSQHPLFPYFFFSSPSHTFGLRHRDRVDQIDSKQRLLFCYQLLPNLSTRKRRHLSPPLSREPTLILSRKVLATCVRVAWQSSNLSLSTRPSAPFSDRHWTSNRHSTGQLSYIPQNEQDTLQGGECR